MEKLVFQLSVTEYRFRPSPASLSYVLFFINTKVRLNLMTKWVIEFWLSIAEISKLNKKVDLPEDHASVSNSG